MPYIITSTHISLFSIRYIEASFMPRLTNLGKLSFARDLKESLIWKCKIIKYFLHFHVKNIYTKENY